MTEDNRRFADFEEQLRVAAKEAAEFRGGVFKSREFNRAYELGIAEGVRLALGVWDHT